VVGVDKGCVGKYAAKLDRYITVVCPKQIFPAWDSYLGQIHAWKIFLAGVTSALRFLVPNTWRFLAGDGFSIAVFNSCLGWC
jgi:hypothetical protein